MFIATPTSTTDPLQSRAAQATTTSTSSSSSTSDVSSLGSTFITLLVQELQNQDPTAPMDSTQMVGQMISLNQLDQLSGIHQVLTSAFGASGAGTGPAIGGATGAVHAPEQATSPAAIAPAAANPTPIFR